MKTIIFQSDFSLTNWYNSVGAAIGSQLSKLNAAKLLEQLGIAKYKQEVPCQRSGPNYSPSDNGWKKGEKILFLHFVELILC